MAQVTSFLEVCLSFDMDCMTLILSLPSIFCVKAWLCAGKRFIRCFSIRLAVIASASLKTNMEPTEKQLDRLALVCRRIW
jgi:hypothetical protein